MTRRQKEEWFFRILIILLIAALMFSYFKTEIAASNRQAIRKALRDIKNTESGQLTQRTR